MWKACRMVFPGMLMKGCHFHFCQAIYRKVQEVGLISDYKENRSVCKMIRHLFALAFLPEEHVERAFKRLEEKMLALNDPRINVLINYFEENWLSEHRFNVTDWCVFMRYIRTNNDVEGWHRRLNGNLPHPHPNLYQLLLILYRESLICKINVQLVSDHQLSRRQKKNYKSKECQIKKLWQKYQCNEISTSSLLKKATHFVINLDQ